MWIWIPRLNKPNSNAGFTLVEVMVALAVVAIALPALMFSVKEQLDGTAYVRDKTQAEWVASNKLTEIRLTNRSTGAVPGKKMSGRETLAGRDWEWIVNTKAFEQNGMKELHAVEVQVREAGNKSDTPLVTLYGIIRKHQAIPFAAQRQAQRQNSQGGQQSQGGQTGQSQSGGSQTGESQQGETP